MIWVAEKDKQRENERHLDIYPGNITWVRQIFLLMGGKHIKIIKIQNGNSILVLNHPGNMVGKPSNCIRSQKFLLTRNTALNSNP